MTTQSARRLPVLRLAALTIAALAVHGYHLGVDDGEIYVPAARKLLNPNLYQFARNFSFRTLIYPCSAPLSHGQLA